jgi:hypothetical protein
MTKDVLISKFKVPTEQERGLKTTTTLCNLTEEKL